MVDGSDVASVASQQAGAFSSEWGTLLVDLPRNDQPLASSVSGSVEEAAAGPAGVGRLGAPDVLGLRLDSVVQERQLSRRNLSDCVKHCVEASPERLPSLVAMLVRLAARLPDSGRSSAAVHLAVLAALASEDADIGTTVAEQLISQLYSDADTCAREPKRLLELYDASLAGSLAPHTGGQLARLLPKYVSLLGRLLSVVVTDPDTGDRLDAQQMVARCLRNLCAADWPDACALALISACREFPVADPAARTMLTEKALMVGGEVSPSLLPAVTYELVAQGDQTQRALVVEGVCGIFHSYECSPAAARPAAILRAQASTLLQLGDAVKTDRQLVRAILTKAHRLTHTPFGVLLLLTVAAVPAWTRPALAVVRDALTGEVGRWVRARSLLVPEARDLLRLATASQFASTAKDWFTEPWLDLVCAAGGPATASLLIAAVRATATNVGGLEHVLPPLLTLATDLVDAAISSTPATASVNERLGHIGTLVRSVALRSQGPVVTVTVEHVLAAAEAHGLTDSLSVYQRLQLHRMLDLLSLDNLRSRDHSTLTPVLKHSLHMLPQLDADVGESVLRFILPVVLRSPSLLDALVIMLRKSMYEPQDRVRLWAVRSMLTFAAALERAAEQGGLGSGDGGAAGPSAASQANTFDTAVSQADLLMSASASVSLQQMASPSQGVAAAPRSQARAMAPPSMGSLSMSPGTARSLARELLQYLSRALEASAVVRERLYASLQATAEAAPTLVDGVLRLLAPHLHRYAERGPVELLDSCFDAGRSGTEPVEPLHRLMTCARFCLEQSRLQTEELGDADDELTADAQQVSASLKALRDRFTAPLIESFRCDPQSLADLRGDAAELARRGARARVLLQALEASMEDAFFCCVSSESSSDAGRRLADQLEEIRGMHALVANGYLTSGATFALPMPPGAPAPGPRRKRAKTSSKVTLPPSALSPEFLRTCCKLWFGKFDVSSQEAASFRTAFATRMATYPLLESHLVRTIDERIRQPHLWTWADTGFTVDASRARLPDDLGRWATLGDDTLLTSPTPASLPPSLSESAASAGSAPTASLRCCSAVNLMQTVAGSLYRTACSAMQRNGDRALGVLAIDVIAESARLFAERGEYDLCCTFLGELDEDVVRALGADAATMGSRSTLTCVAECAGEEADALMERTPVAAATPLFAPTATAPVSRYPLLLWDKHLVHFMSQLTSLLSHDPMLTSLGPLALGFVRLLGEVFVGMAPVFVSTTPASANLQVSKRVESLRGTLSVLRQKMMIDVDKAGGALTSVAKSLTSVLVRAAMLDVGSRLALTLSRELKYVYTGQDGAVQYVAPTTQATTLSCVLGAIEDATAACRVALDALKADPVRLDLTPLYNRIKRLEATVHFLVLARITEAVPSITTRFLRLITGLFRLLDACVRSGHPVDSDGFLALTDATRDHLIPDAVALVRTLDEGCALGGGDEEGGEKGDFSVSNPR